MKYDWKLTCLYLFIHKIDNKNDKNNKENHSFFTCF